MLVSIILIRKWKIWVIEIGTGLEIILYKVEKDRYSPKKYMKIKTGGFLRFRGNTVVYI